MRDAFREIVSGWTLIDDLDDLAYRIDRAAAWAKDHPLDDDERATIGLMIECQIARGFDQVFTPPARPGAWPAPPGAGGRS